MIQISDFWSFYFNGIYKTRVLLFTTDFRYTFIFQQSLSWVCAPTVKARERSMPLIPLVNYTSPKRGAT